MVVNLANAVPVILRRAHSRRFASYRSLSKLATLDH